jgi:hypothetical protein
MFLRNVVGAEILTCCYRALSAAVEKGQVEIVRLLIEHGADSDYKWYEVFILQDAEKFTENFKELLKLPNSIFPHVPATAEPGSLGILVKSPMSVAMKREDQEIYRFLAKVDVPIVMQKVNSESLYTPPSRSVEKIKEVNSERLYISPAKGTEKIKAGNLSLTINGPFLTNSFEGETMIDTNDVMLVVPFKIEDQSGQELDVNSYMYVRAKVIDNNAKDLKPWVVIGYSQSLGERIIRSGIPRNWLDKGINLVITKQSTTFPPIQLKAK